MANTRLKIKEERFIVHSKRTKIPELTDVHSVVPNDENNRGDGFEAVLEKVASNLVSHDVKNPKEIHKPLDKVDTPNEVHDAVPGAHNNLEVEFEDHVR